MFDGGISTDILSREEELCERLELEGLNFLLIFPAAFFAPLSMVLPERLVPTIPEGK
jgi:hypothetical protein